MILKNAINYCGQSSKYDIGSTRIDDIVTANANITARGT